MLLSDEMVPPSVAEGLRRRGIDVSTVRELDLLGSSDEPLLEHACAHRMAIVSSDPRGYVHQSAHVAHHGIILYSQGSLTGIGDLVQAIADVVERNPAGLDGQLLWLARPCSSPRAAR